MSQRAACQLERLGFNSVFDFVHGKAYWLASGRRTTRTHPIDRVIDHMDTTAPAIRPDAAVSEALDTIAGVGRIAVISESDVVVGTVRAERLRDAEATSTVGDIMSVGPTTIRPDEDAAAVRDRMTKRSVSSLLVTTPTGELLGSFNLE